MATQRTESIALDYSVSVRSASWLLILCVGGAFGLGALICASNRRNSAKTKRATSFLPKPGQSRQKAPGVFKITRITEQTDGKANVRFFGLLHVQPELYKTASGSRGPTARGYVERLL